MKIKELAKKAYEKAFRYRWRILGVVSVAALIATICIFSPRANSAATLFINTTTAVLDTRKDSVSIVSSDYFQAKLIETVDKEKGHFAGADIEKSEPGEDFKYIFFQVSDSAGSPIYFKQPSDFLNFMSAREYVLESAVRTSRRANEYVFKKSK
ncbi:MAG: hypothetical protein BWY57_02814 [Betaproteobacteria bacterium ADurb.Bin341]|nr:MAG: hypothetical protein BWY57_02814 [Betaproteobacteria bacterium ADurb.Bin341]